MLNSEDHFNNPSLNKTLQCICNTLKDFERVYFFPYLARVKQSCRLAANKACLVPPGNLSINGDPTLLQQLHDECFIKHFLIEIKRILS